MPLAGNLPKVRCASYKCRFCGFINKDIYPCSFVCGGLGCGTVLCPDSYFCELIKDKVEDQELLAKDVYATDFYNVSIGADGLNTYFVAPARMTNVNSGNSFGNITTDADTIYLDLDIATAKAKSNCVSRGVDYVVYRLEPVSRFNYASK